MAREEPPYAPEAGDESEESVNESMIRTFGLDRFLAEERRAAEEDRRRPPT
jgi:hypothetical protein